MPSGQSIWFRDEGPARKPRLSRERIVRAAVELLDAEGAECFSMRALAARLRAGTMSLYEYVTSKEDVLDLALDEVFGEVEMAETDASWRTILIGQLSQSRQVMHRHPWIPALVATRPLAGPNALARSEFFYSALARAGLRGPALTAAVGALTSYVNGYVSSENIWWSRIRAPAADAEIRDQVQRHLDERLKSYPTLARHAEVGNGDFDDQFALGLAIILDGIEARLA
ncbi:TetR/AcrR family transcriptional regulator C-terminal domain-containing protein [Streptosporangium sp. NPDC049248]|uniref:TetR/AcrR family transcriptional regulator n=1 Tax=Streptosporangium sp. NPDC049248 TaxID=3155651 RepID=UPI003422578A